MAKVGSVLVSGGAEHRVLVSQASSIVYTLASHVCFMIFFFAN